MAGLFSFYVISIAELGLDLVEVALQMSQDNKTQIEQWMAEGKVAKVSDELAKEWLEADAILWAVVVKPWIMVQPQTVH